MSETPAAQIAAAQARAATAAAAYRATSWQLPVVCAVLEQDGYVLADLTTRLLALVTRVLTPQRIGTLIVPPGIIYDEQGQRCYWCTWQSPDEDAPPVHARGCLVADVVAVLEGTINE